MCVIYVYIARCCAPFTLAHKNKVHTLSCGHEETAKTQTLEKGAHTTWQLRKVERSPQRKRVAPKRARRRAEPRRPQRRDSSNQQVTARPFHRRTQTSEASRALKRNDENFKRISSFLFICDRARLNLIDAAA